MMADTPVMIVDYDPRWSEIYTMEIERILRVIEQYMAAMEHCGGTSVPGLAAKPIVDILGGLRLLKDGVECIKPLARLGYEYHPHLEVCCQTGGFSCGMPPAGNAASTYTCTS